MNYRSLDYYILLLLILQNLPIQSYPNVSNIRKKSVISFIDHVYDLIVNVKLTVKWTVFFFWLYLPSGAPTFMILVAVT